MRARSGSEGGREAPWEARSVAARLADMLIDRASVGQGGVASLCSLVSPLTTAVPYGMWHHVFGGVIIISRNGG